MKYSFTKDGVKAAPGSGQPPLPKAQTDRTINVDVTIDEPERIPCRTARADIPGRGIGQ